MSTVKTGIQCFDENGNCTLDVTNRICKYIGTGDTGLSDGSLQNDLLKGVTEFWLVPTAINFSLGNLNYRNVDMPYFEVDENTGVLSWRFRADTFAIKIGYSFIYGAV